MEETQRRARFDRVDRQIGNIRTLYSAIGQPLPAEVIEELYRQLGTVLNAACPESDGRKAAEKRRRP